MHAFQSENLKPALFNTKELQKVVYYRPLLCIKGVTTFGI